ncbi:LuxR family transcriptional regulator [Roseomonas nepalensis]|uniref:LuxR family transcriptional regulator n=1 Tax=Muricoccus nepalensis TaxID=1854500 RepID=A0A502GA15_9PROT|nr:LuxR family transcriptional regulator [Roseomonas nepalensis]TPG58472.1 LuxR family transcriptional regulator [Roseomonas nepalensis]
MRLLDDPVFLSETVGAIYDCTLRPDAWPEVLERLCDAIGGKRGALGVSTVAGGRAAIAAIHGLPWTEEDERSLAINPFLPLAMVQPIDRAFVGSRDYGMEALQATRYYREYLRPRGFRDLIGFRVTDEGSSFGNWLLVTGDDRDVLTPAEIAGLELVAPHVRRAVEISQVLGAQRLMADSYRATLDRIDAAVLLLDGARRPVYANPRAEGEIAGGAVLRLQDGRLRGATEAAERALRRAVGEEGGRSGGVEASLAGTDGEERLLFTLGLDAEGCGGLRRTLLVLRSPREDTRNPVANAARAFGLTPAQVQVLAFLTRGHAPDEIAGLLGVSVTTVRSHLADLFARSGTSRQAELVARTLSFASPIRMPEP